jgi:hypothetical protein
VTLVGTTGTSGTTGTTGPRNELTRVVFSNEDGMRQRIPRT